MRHLKISAAFGFACLMTCLMASFVMREAEYEEKDLGIVELKVEQVKKDKVNATTETLTWN